MFQVSFHKTLSTYYIKSKVLNYFSNLTSLLVNHLRPIAVHLSINQRAQRKTPGSYRTTAYEEKVTALSPILCCRC